MTTPPHSGAALGLSKADKALENVSLFYSILKSLKNFNDQEIKGVITGQFKTTDEENCFLLGYWRATYNVDTMLEFDNVCHFQAVANLARTMIEIAADVHLVEIIPDAVNKLLFFNRLEKLRAARGILAYESSHSMETPFDTSSYKQFVLMSETEIENYGAALWPNIKLKYLTHWTGMDLSQRTRTAGRPVEELYHVFHRILSWYVHSGGAGVMGLPALQFSLICSISYRIATLTFEDVLIRTAKKFRLTMVDDKLEKKLRYARSLPLTSSPEQEMELARDLSLI